MRWLYLFLLASLLLGCHQSSKPQKKVLKLSVSTEIPPIDPALCYDTVCNQIVYQIYETLFEYDYDKRPYQLKPLLLSELPQLSSNKTTITFKLKPGVFYHPSPHLPQNRQVRAEDFITAFKRIAFLPTRSQGWWLFEKKIIGLDEWRTKVGDNFDLFQTPVEGLKIIDDLTFQIHLTKPYPQLNYALSMPFTSPIPYEALAKLNHTLIHQSIGTGPFVLETFNSIQGAKLRKNSNYHISTQPQIDGIEIHVMKEAQTSWLNFNTGKLDIINLTKDYFQIALDAKGQLNPELSKNGVELQLVPTLIYYWLSFNMNDPLWGKNLLLRKAIASAVDREKFIRLFTQNTGLLANSIYPPGVFGYEPRVGSFNYNLEQARQYLNQAGFPDGTGLPTIVFDVRGNNTINRQIAEFIQQQLAQIGIKVQISTLPFPQFLEKARKGELQFWMGGWAMDYPDAENAAQLLSSKNFAPGPNYNYYAKPEVDQLIENISLLDDGPQKQAMMRKIDDHVQADLPWIMLYYVQSYVLNHSRIKNFKYSDVIYNYPKYLSIL